MTRFAHRLAGLVVSAALVASPAFAQELITHGSKQPAPAADQPDADSFDPLPPGTPTDDYHFMAWCTGILSGHMELYGKVKPELDVISKRWNSLDEDNKQEADQQAYGRVLLARFQKVMAADEARTPALAASGQDAVKLGRSSWDGIDKLDTQAQAYSWMNFGLPGQCEARVAMLEKTPVSTSKTAVAAAKPTTKAKPGKKAKAATARPTVTASAKPEKTLHGILLTDDPAFKAGKETEIAPGVVADPHKSLVQQLAEQKKAELAKKQAAEKAAAAAEAGASTSSAADAGLRP